MIIPLPPVVAEQCAVGRRLREVREARGFSLDALAEDAGLPAPLLRLAEQGRIRLTSTELHALIMSLHITLTLLFAPEVDISRLRRL